MTVEVGRGGVSFQLNEEGVRKVSFIIQSDVPRSFVDRDMHCECIGQNGS